MAENDGDNKGDKLLYCSFCGKSQHEVRKLIAGPSVFVCDECVELCNEIIREEAEDVEAEDAREAAFRPRRKSVSGWMITSSARQRQRKFFQWPYTITISGLRTQKL